MTKSDKYRKFISISILALGIVDQFTTDEKVKSQHKKLVKLHKKYLKKETIDIDAFLKYSIKFNKLTELMRNGK